MRKQNSAVPAALAALCLATLGLLGSPGLASAAERFGSEGSGAGELRSPSGLAVDSSNGHLFVADQGNQRVSVFASDGDFLFAFGWGVADGTSVTLQTCTATCFSGLATEAAGGFNFPKSVAVDNSGGASQGDVYVHDAWHRVQRFSIDDNGSAAPGDDFAVFEGAWGAGVITGGASGKGDLTAGSAVVENASTTKKAFLVGQTISGTGIPVGTKIVGIGAETITLSKPATASGTAVTLAVAEGAGNVPVNEVQVLRILQPTYDPSDEITNVTENFTLGFRAPEPSSTGFVETAPIPTNASAAQLQAALEALPNLDPGDITVTSPNPGGVVGTSGGPYTITFHGARYADTDVGLLVFTGTGPQKSIGAVQNGGGSSEVCSSVNTSACVGAAVGFSDGQFADSKLSLATGPDGTVYVADYRRVSNNLPEDSRIQRFEPSGSFLEASDLPAGEFTEGIAVDSAGDVYSISEESSIAEERMTKYDVSGPTATVLESSLVDSPRSITLDPAGNVYVGTRDNGFPTVASFSPAGEPLKRFGYGELKGNAVGLAYYPTPDGEVFVSDEFAAEPILLLPSPAPGPVSCCAEAKPIGNSKATLNAGLNPEGDETKYHFEYVDDANFQNGGFSNPATKSTPEGTLAAGIDLQTVSAQIGILPETTYHFRLVASNAEGSTSQSAEFTSLPPLEIGDSWSTDVDFTSARLNAQVNPLGIPTTAYFQYVEEQTFQVSGFSEAEEAPAVGDGADPIDLGSGEGFKVAAVQITGLEPDTAYRFRVVAEDEENGVHFVTVFGDPVAFRTYPTRLRSSASCPNVSFRVGASANLPDCRAYEMVSPVEKGNADIAVRYSFQNWPSRLDQSSEDGNRFSFSSEKSFGDAVAAPYSSQYLASREAGKGWVIRGISPPRGPLSVSSQPTIKYDTDFKAFAPDLSSSWVVHNTGLMHDECAVPGFVNLYRRDNLTGKYEALTTAQPLSQGPEFYLPETQGTSADGTRTVFRAPGRLSEEASSAVINGHPVQQIYMHVAGEEAGSCGELRLVSVLASGKAASGGASVGTGHGGSVESREHILSNAVSDDGTRVFWTAKERGPGALYLWSEESGKSVQVSLGPAQFWTAAADGSKALYSVGENLFEYDTEAKTSKAVAGRSTGIAGAGEDLSRFYFVSKEALEGAAVADKPNLYLREGGVSTFIATVAEKDTTRGVNFEFDGFAITDSAVAPRGTRTTPDGGTLAFVSTASLTGYDNKSASDGREALEIYVYEATTKELACVSCNPAGSRPQGRPIEGANSNVISVAAQMAPAENVLFSPRVLSSDGSRLFFEAYDALVPRDTNGRADVYQWQRAAGEDACEQAGAELFVPQAGGCLSLISSGQSPTDSAMVDATPSGSDVFFKTASSLLPQDPGLIDIYDARVGGGLPQPPTPPAPCEGEACQGPLSAPDDPSPASGSGEYAGNVAPEKPRCPKGKGKGKGCKPCPKGKVRRHGRCVKKHQKTGKPAKKHSKQAGQDRRAGR
jgi:hypothetical protein